MTKNTPPHPERRPPAGRPAQSGSYLTALALVGQLGLVMASSVVLALLAGIWLDALLGGGGVVIAICVLAGVAGGLFGVYGILRKEIT